MIYSIIIAPIEAVVDWIFSFILNKIPSLGVIGAICGVSVCVNILALPLYNIAESIQEKERQINKKMEPRVKRIKKGFKGDEQFMILSEYYRQNNYHPLYALRGSLSILIEIPFFIAAYNYLSASEILKEASFWIFSNLGEADRMFSLTLGSLIIPINILPILMTAINFVSGYIYTKNATTRDKIQLYALGLVFLVLLYNSPSGLVIYWILNNIFSLVKTIVLKTKHPGRFLHAFLSLGLIAFAWKFRDASERSRFYLVAVVAFLFTSAPLFMALLKKSDITEKAGRITAKSRSTGKYFILTLMSGLALAFLCGFLLPSSTIATSPEEFSYLGSISKPTQYVWSTLWFFTGLFVFWPCCIYKMFGDKVRKWESALLFTVFVVALVDAFVFKGEYGKLNTQFYVEDSNTLDSITMLYKTGPLLVAAAAFASFLVVDYFGKTGIAALLCFSVTIGEAGLGTVKLNTINRKFNEYTELISTNESAAKPTDEVESVYHLSKDGKNVVVLFLDRAFNGFLPYTLEAIPELKEQLSGFVYYPNTVSFGGNTTFASPAMMGGYEYTPEKMNERDDLLVDIHNEASLVAPVLFKNAGYRVTVTDPPFPNYSWRDDLSVYESVEGIHSELLYGKYTDKYYKELEIEYSTEDSSLSTRREAVNFSVLQILPPFLRYTFEVSCRKVNNQDFRDFVQTFSNLYYLDELTDFTGEADTYTFIGNDSPHNPIELNNDLLFASSDDDSFISNYPDNSESTYKHYTAFTASMKQVGKWLDWLRENGVYDNTRIVIVSDHGYSFESDIVEYDQAQFLPLLLFKDFSAEGELTYDYTFMTNADTILLATEDLEEISCNNPYTGKELTAEKNDGINAYPVVDSREWNAPMITDYTKFTLDKNVAWHVSDNIFNPSNWIKLSEWEEMTK